MTKSLRANSLTIKNGSLDLYKPQEKETGLRKSLQIKSFDADLNQLNLSLKKGKRKKRIYFKSGRAVCKELTSFAKDGFYKLNAKSLNYDKPGDAVYLTGLRLIPSYNKYLFSKKKGYQINRFDMSIDSVVITGLDTDALLNRKQLYGERMVIRKMDLDIFRNQRINKRAGIKKNIYPFHMVRKIKFNTTLDEIVFYKLSVKYSAHLAKAGKPGSVMITDINGRIANFSNHEKNKTLKLTATGNMMGHARLSAAMTVPLTKAPHRFTANASLGKMNLESLNNILANNYIRVDKGELKKMTLSVKGNPNRITGEMRMQYRDLKVSLLKKKNPKRRRRFVSFLANWVLHKHNPKRFKPMRVGNIFYEKETPMPFFTFIWKAILEGIKSSTGLKKGKQP